MVNNSASLIIFIKTNVSLILGILCSISHLELGAQILRSMNQCNRWEIHYRLANEWEECECESHPIYKTDYAVIVISEPPCELPLPFPDGNCPR